MQALFKTKNWDEASGYYRAAMALRPETAAVYTGLGNALREKGQLDAAIKEHLTAIDLAPNYAEAHNCLGNALFSKGQPDAAIREYRTAIELDPKNAQVHNNLGNALRAKDRLDEAIQEYRAALDLDPKHSDVHNGLGNALRAKGQPDAAIREYRTALDLDPKNARAHYNLGNVLWEKGLLDEAGKEYRAALDCDPKHAMAHTNLGNGLESKGQLDAAIQEYRTAIDLDPKLFEARGALGETLLKRGDFAEAREASRRCLELLPINHPQRQEATRQLQRCEQLLAADRRLLGILEGKEQPSNNAERLTFAWLFQQPYKGLYAASARFYAQAFTDNAKLADDMWQHHRYNAACAAALAGCGQGMDAEKLEEKERARLRQQALEWLRADLALWSRLAGNEDPKAREALQQQMKHRQADADFVGVRDPDALAKLPEAERDDWRKLWDEAAAVLKKAEERK